MFENLNPYYIVLAFSVIFVTGYFADKIKSKLTDNTNEYDIIKKYLLNESPLYGHNKPKLWIHTKYEYNARRWESFHSRTSMDLNQPYLHITVKSIINHCGDDFNICLIDDETFSKLIPSWDLDLKTIPEPMRSRVREQGLLTLIYYYGGMIVPNSFLCSRNLKPLYDESVVKGIPFVCESVSRSINIAKHKTRELFIPSTYFMGSPKNNETVRELIEYMKMKNRNVHFTNEQEYLGEIQEWCLTAVNNGDIQLIDGDRIGIKFKKSRKPISIEHLFGENFINLSPDTFGIYIPENEVLERIKYQWFSVMSTEEILNSNMIITKYMKSSVVDTLQSNKKPKSSEEHSVVSI